MLDRIYNQIGSEDRRLKLAPHRPLPQCRKAPLKGLGGHELCVSRMGIPQAGRFPRRHLS